jgi:hypothetical protein
MSPSPPCAAFVLALALTGCLEVIDHTPPGACATDEDCACDLECYVPEGQDLHVCGARRSNVCDANHLCTPPALCHAITRDGGQCGFSACQTR